MKNLINSKWLLVSAAALTITLSGMFYAVNLAGATVNYTHNGKITLCHWDNGQGGKYTSNDVSINSTDGNGHDGHANDIIPPYHYDFIKQPHSMHIVGDYLGKNFNASGMLTWNNGTCVPAPTATPTLSPTPTITPTPTVTPTPTITPSATPTPTPGDSDCSEGQRYDQGLQICIQCNGEGACEVTTTDTTPTPTPTAEVTPTPTTGAGSGSSSSSNNVSLVDAASAVNEDKSGRVNAPSMAGTGMFESNLATAEQLLGILLSSAGVFVYGKKKSSKNK